MDIFSGFPSFLFMVLFHFRCHGSAHTINLTFLNFEGFATMCKYLQTYGYPSDIYKTLHDIRVFWNIFLLCSCEFPYYFLWNFIFLSSQCVQQSMFFSILNWNSSLKIFLYFWTIVINQAWIFFFWKIHNHWIYQTAVF